MSDGITFARTEDMEKEGLQRDQQRSKAWAAMARHGGLAQGGSIGAQGREYFATR
jgi:hypothetical protein